MKIPKRLNEKLRAYWECKATFGRIKIENLMKKEKLKEEQCKKLEKYRDD